MILTDEEVARLPRCDVTLRGFRWLDADGGIELLLEDLASDGTIETICLQCSWVSDLDVTLDFNDGPPLTWDAAFARQPSGRWAVEFDFADRGRFAFQCEALAVAAETPAREIPG